MDEAFRPNTILLCMQDVLEFNAVFLFCLIIGSVQEDAIFMHPELYLLSLSLFVFRTCLPFSPASHRSALSFLLFPLVSLSLSDTLCLVSLNVGKAHPTTQHGAQ